MCSIRALLLVSIAQVIFSSCLGWIFEHADGVIATGAGWSADVVVSKGVIHAARYNYDAMTLEYAYRRVGDDDWNVETVDRFRAEDEKVFMIYGSEVGGLLRLAAEGDEVFLAYLGLEKGRRDGALDGFLETSVKLAERKSGQWQIRELFRPESRVLGLEIYDVAHSKGKTYVEYVYCQRSFEQCSSEWAVVTDRKIDLFPLGAEFPTEAFPAEGAVVIGDLVLEAGKVPSCVDIFNGTAACFMARGPDGEIAAIFMGEAREGKIRYALRSEGWKVKEVSFPPVKWDFMLQQFAKYDTHPFLLLLRFADGVGLKGSIGIGTVKDNSFEVEWFDAPPIIYDRGVRFDVSLPYVVVTFPALDLSKTEKRSGPYGTAHYNISRGTHHVYVSDGKAWTHQTIP